MQIKVKQDLWGSNHLVELNMPARWDVEVLSMEGDRKAVLTEKRYRDAILSLVPMCKGKKEICILFDDLSRPTRVYEIAPFLFELFEESHIRDEQVRFICALGNHAPLDNAAFQKKLGLEILTRFPVYNHNPYENCEPLGTTKRGTPVAINKEYLACDMRIGISSFVPHSFCGFGGGYKLVVPGVSHIDAVAYHHGKLMTECRDTCYGIGRYHENPLLADLQEAGRMARLDATISVLVNSGAEHVDIYAGHPDGLYDTMVPVAAAHYGTSFRDKADVVFANAYGKANESVIALSLAELLLKDEGGFVVILCDIPGGQVVHYLLGRFGKESWGRLAFGVRENDRRVRRVFVYSRFPDLANEWWFGPSDQVHRTGNMDEIMGILEGEFAGRQVHAHVIPDATIQMLSSNGF